ncbi:transient receptor potential cation channel subfamily M member 6 isoform X1 [Labeo rohita]|uniref:transient receptor potential cation channel subfamily M member 6 isoform X1 n=2 Tax=Labeo rohita TaxID=84645 RepID=UPI0021E25021|nr:transient receptor potential cation channel subfamily M member 6 isoform X1 [Labeo rohita]XP_050965496.1 transient receptor potential cation channel subfamily M member 6 isoform X1 [Labeo rohita]XP_050965497.1 transient receptor potential cation channel subfamily M member 6 isoform X1 [Labeo rohita]
MSRLSWIQANFCKRECVKFLPASRDHHRCYPVCQVCQSLVRCCCGRLIAEHVGPYSGLLGHGPGPDSAEEEEWSVLRHTSSSPTDAFGWLDFQGSTKRTCHAKYVRLSSNTSPELLVQLMLREWHMEMPKLVISVHGGTDNFPLSPRVCQAFSTGLVTAAESTGAWILTDGINTGVSKYVGDAVKVYGSYDRRKRNVVGITPWGIIENNSDLIGRDVFRHYQALGNPLSKRASLNGMHSHFLLVDDGTVGKSGCQIGLRKWLERHIHLQKIHPRLPPHVPLVCVVVEGGPAVLSVVLDYVCRSSPVPVLVFEGTGRAADLLALIHKQTAVDRKLDSDIKEDVLLRIEETFGVERPEASELLNVLMECMEHRDLISIFDSESEDLQEADVAILTTSLRGTRGSPEEQLNITLAWDRADVAKDNIFVYGQQWQVGSLEQTMLDALVMDRVSFVKLLIENGMTMNRFLTVSRLEQLYNIHKGFSDCFLRHLIEDAKQTRLPAVYRMSLIDIGMVIEYLIGGAYRSTYTRKSFRTMYSRFHNPAKEGAKETSSPFSKARKATSESSPSRSHFHRTAQPCRHQEGAVAPQDVKSTQSPEFVCTFNDLFVWAVLKHRQEMAMFLWQHGEQAMARAVVACKLYRAMAMEAKESNMGDTMAEELKKNSLEFGQLAVDLLDQAFKKNERMAMKMLTWEMKDWSNFTCLQMAVSSRLRPFVAHNCTQMLLTDLWMGRLNMSKNSWFKIIASILMPVAIQKLEFKSQAEMSHVPQPQEALQFGWESEEEGATNAVQGDEERGSRCLCSWTRKVYDFYTAPVVKFWFHTMAFLGFLMMFSYTVLVRLDEKPNIQECLVITYILTMAAEKAREVWVLEPRKFTMKLKVWFSEYWNINDFMGIILFLVGVSLRWHQETRLASHIVYSLDFIFWSVRLLDLFAVNQHAGPYLTMITKMMSNMFYIVVIMAIVLVSFGTSRKSILSPNEEPSWSLLRDVVFQPYWMMFGEVYAGEIDVCKDETSCVHGAFLTPFLQAVYLFIQYIIMVNVLIAFFNNVYFDMSSISRKLWKYNRYRYIMTYQEKPWLPPPLILLSHMTLCLSSMWQKHRKASKQGRTGLKLLLAPDDLKKLHEFEEKCVAGYFRDKKESQQGSEINRIRSAADKAEEMAGILVEVAEKINIIQDNMRTLDSHLGELQDLSALAVDTLNVLSATDNQQQEVARLGQSRNEQVSHSCCLRIGGSVGPSHALPSPKHYRSMPPSLLRGLGPGRQRPSLELPPGTSAGSFEVRSKGMLESPQEEDGSFRWTLQRSDSREGVCHRSLPHLCTRLRDKGMYGSGEPSRASSPTMPLMRDFQLQPSHEESMEEEDDEDAMSRSSSRMFLLTDSHSDEDRPAGIRNPAFYRLDDAGHFTRPQRLLGQKWAFDLEQSRSLSASVETMAMPDTPTSEHGKHTLLMPPHHSHDQRGLSKIFKRQRSFGKKSIKTRTGTPENVKLDETHIHEFDPRRKMKRKVKGLFDRRFRASVSLTQLNVDQVDFTKLAPSWLNTVTPGQPLLSSWARPVSQRPSVSNMTQEVKGSTFKLTEDLGQHYSAMERNNLMRLAHSIPFTPLSLMGGVEVCIYSLEEAKEGSSFGDQSSSISTWIQHGRTAVLQPLAHQEVLDGGLRRATKVVCTWSEGDVLKLGSVYVVKAFRPEVVRIWQKVFPISTSLHLCLREIQQQRAAQNLMQRFNKIKPSSVHYSPRFLDVSLLHWRSDGQWLTVEKNMSGHFRKYNNNTGEEISPSSGLEETILAFSHWTYEYTNRELLVLDLQGVGADLTDPSLIRVDDTSSSGEMAFGPANLGDDAIQSFVLKHTCNSCCKKLGLSDLRSCGSQRKSVPGFDEASSIV